MRLYIKFRVMEMHQGRVEVVHKDQTVIATGAYKAATIELGGVGQWSRALRKVCLTVRQVNFLRDLDLHL